MSITTVSILLAFFGLLMGSFAGATVWRLRARQLRLDEKEGEKVSKTEKQQVQHLKKQTMLKDRSICLHCGHTLRWYDLVPLVSWLETGGRCRYCHKKIGYFEPLIEVATAVFFVVSFLFWPQPLDSSLQLAQFAIWLSSGVGLIILFAYDLRWYLLPNPVVFPLIGLGLLNALLVLIDNHFLLSSVFSVLYACGILSGLYYVIFIFSNHKWVGFGDVKLGLALALLLAHWELAALTLFLANLIGTLLFLPMIFLGKIKRGAHIPFGPLLISGYFIAGLFGFSIINWYLSMTLGVS